MAANQENIEAKLCAYVDDELTARERTEIEEHLAANPHHRRLLKELAQTRSLLRALPRAKSPADLVEEFQSQLERTALLDDEEAEPTGAVLQINRRPQVFAAAALVLLSLGLAAVIYKVLPSSASKHEVAMGPSGSTPALVTADDSGAPDGRPSATPTTPGARPSDPSEGVVTETRKELAGAGDRPDTGGFGGGFGGGSGGGGGGAGKSAAGDGSMGKSGPALAAKPVDRKLQAGSDEVLALQDKMAKREGTNNDTAPNTVNVAGSGTSNGSSPVANDGSSAKADETSAFVVVVNATNPTLANGDVSSYLKQNNITFSESAEPAAIAQPAPNQLHPTPAAPAPTPAPIVTGVQRDKEAVAKPQATTEKKPGWYMGADGQVHFGRVEEAEVAKAKQAAPAGVNSGVALNEAPGTDRAKASVANGGATQPLHGIELTNSYNGNTTFGNNTANPVTYHAVMSRRQVINLNNRLSQREGQSAEIVSDAVVNRAEGYAITSNLRLNGGNTTDTGAADAQKKVDADAVASSGRRAVAASKSAESLNGQASGVVRRDAAKVQAAGESPTGPLAAAEPSPAKDAAGNNPRSHVSKSAASSDDDRRAGERGTASQDVGGVSQNAPDQVAQTSAAPVNRQEQAAQSKLNDVQVMAQRRTAEPAEPSQSAVMQQQLPAAPPAAPVAAAPQTLAPATVASTASQQAPAQVGSATPQQQAVVSDPDEQPHSVLIVVNGQVQAAMPPAATPATQPAAAPATRPSEATPRESK